jgi:hypothetical protein
MSQFRKKPVVIEASQWFKLGQHPAVLAAPLQPIDGYIVGTHGWIQTLEGGHIVTPGDWIITGVKGEHYPCKPDIFAATYESADATPAEGAQSQDAVNQERERCALLCDDLAHLMENGAGDPEPGGRLRQAARNIRDPNHKPMRLDWHAAIERSDKGSLAALGEQGK